MTRHNMIYRPKGNSKALWVSKHCEYVIVALSFKCFVVKVLLIHFASNRHDSQCSWKVVDMKLDTDTDNTSHTDQRRAQPTFTVSKFSKESNARADALFSNEFIAFRNRVLFAIPNTTTNVWLSLLCSGDKQPRTDLHTAM